VDFDFFSFTSLVIQRLLLTLPSAQQPSLTHLHSAKRNVSWLFFSTKIYKLQTVLYNGFLQDVKITPGHYFLRSTQNFIAYNFNLLWHKKLSIVATVKHNIQNTMHAWLVQRFFTLKQSGMQDAPNSNKIQHRLHNYYLPNWERPVTVKQITEKTGWGLCKHCQFYAVVLVTK
jgi:hypothetical protein